MDKYGVNFSGVDIDRARANHLVVIFRHVEMFLDVIYEILR